MNYQQILTAAFNADYEIVGIDETTTVLAYPVLNNRAVITVTITSQQGRLRTHDTDIVLTAIRAGVRRRESLVPALHLTDRTFTQDLVYTFFGNVQYQLQLQS